MNYPIISRILRTFFNSEDGLSEDVSINLYANSVSSSEIFDELKRELKLAFSDSGLSWLRLLSNEDYEVYCADTEDEAFQYARRILWVPIFGSD